MSFEIKATKVLNFCHFSIRQPINIVFACLEDIKTIVSSSKLTIFVDHMGKVIILFKFKLSKLKAKRLKISRSSEILRLSFEPVWKPKFPSIRYTSTNLVILLESSMLQ